MHGRRGCGRFWGNPNLARSTVLTMMEQQLRRKAYLRRRLVSGVYRYSACSSSAELLRSLVRRFARKKFGGSVAPFVAYLNDTQEVSDSELKELSRSSGGKIESERLERGNSHDRFGICYARRREHFRESHTRLCAGRLVSPRRLARLSVLKRLHLLPSGVLFGGSQPSSSWLRLPALGLRLPSRS